MRPPDRIKYTPQVIKELQKLDTNLWANYKPDDLKTYTLPDDHLMLAYIQTDIETIMIHTSPEQWTHYIIDILSESPIYTQLLGILNLNKIKEAVKIRKNWPLALKNVHKGTELSSKINWQLYNADLLELTNLHRKNKYRRRIQNLLEDCNFHHESCMLATQKYDELINEISDY